MRLTIENVLVGCEAWTFGKNNSEQGQMWADRKSLISLCALILLTMAVTGLSRAEENCGYIDKTGKFMILPQTGNVASPPKFPALGDIRGPFSEGLAAIWRDNKGGFIDETGTVVIPPQFTGGVGKFSEGLANVGMGAKWGFIDKTGTVVIPLQFVYASYFTDGLARVLVKESVSPFRGWSYIDKTGKIVIPNNFAAFSFSEGFAVLQTEEGGKMGYIDKTGKVVIPPQFADAMSFQEGLAAIRTEKEGKWGFIDKSGKVVIPPQFRSAGSFSEGLASVCMAIQ